MPFVVAALTVSLVRIVATRVQITVSRVPMTSHVQSVLTDSLGSVVRGHAHQAVQRASTRPVVIPAGMGTTEALVSSLVQSVQNTALHKNAFGPYDYVPGMVVLEFDTGGIRKSF